MSSHKGKKSLSESAPVHFEISSCPSSETSVKFPWNYLVWSVIKTCVQLSISFVSITFIIQSGFFNPFGYEASVWSRQDLYSLCLPHAIFETVDLFFDVWLTLRVRTRDLPLFTIIHHSMSALYSFYVYTMKDSLTMNFLGLYVAGISCQVVGFLYTLQHLRYRFRLLGLCLLCVQLLYRWPLAVVSCLRAVQYLWECPWIHFVMCSTLLMLDLRWTKWAFKLNNRLLKQHHMKEKANPTFKHSESSHRG